MPDTPITISPVDVGAAPNDNSGDQLRTGGVKLNSNDEKFRDNLNKLFDLLGVDTTATDILGSDVKSLLEAAAAAGAQVFQLRPVWMANDTVEATVQSEDAFYATGDRTVVSAVCVIRGDALTSTGIVTLKLYNSDGTADYLNGGTVDLKGFSADTANPLTLVGSPPLLSTGDSLIARITTAEDDVAGGEVEVYVVASVAS